MHFKRTYIEGIAYAKPDCIYTSAEIELQLAPLYEKLKLPEGRLELMTGIKERKFWSTPLPPSELAAKAAQPLVQDKKIDLLIYAGVCRDRIEPATAAYLHKALALSKSTLFFDLSNACLGFLNAMTVAANCIESGQAKRVLIASGENGKPLLDETLSTLLSTPQTRSSIKPYFANLTIGSAATAMLLCDESLIDEPKNFLKVESATHGVDTEQVHLCEGHARDGAYAMATDSEALLRAGVALAKKTWLQFCEDTQHHVHLFKHIITHQVGRQHQLELYKELGLNPHYDFSIYETWGNTGSASIPLSLSQYQKMHKTFLGPIALLGIGSGLATCMIHLTPCYV